MINNVLVLGVQQTDSVIQYMYLFFFKFLSQLQSTEQSPCDIQEALIGCLFYT